MEEFDIQRLMDNINSIIQQKNIKIGEMESDIGVSPGYISRLTKKGNGAATSADLIWKVAKYLGVSVDFLMATQQKRQIISGICRGLSIS